MSGFSALANLFKVWRLPKVLLGLFQLFFSYQSPALVARRMAESTLTADLAIFQLAALTEIRPGRKVMLLHLEPSVDEGKQEQAAATRDNHTEASPEPADPWTIFFVHGSMATMQQYEAQIEALHRGGAHRIVAYDWYGCGASPRPREYDAYSQQNLFDDLQAVFDSYAGRKNLVVGHSYGTSEAIRLALVRPKQVHGLFLIGPGYLPSHSKFPPPLEKARQVFSAPLMILNIIRPLLSQGFAERAFHPRTRQEACDTHRRLLKRAEAFSGTNSMHVCQAFYQQLQWVNEAQIHEVPCAVVLVVGEGDKVTAAKYAEDMEKILRRNANRYVAMELVREAGHQVMQEKPELVTNLVSDFQTVLEQPPVPADSETVEM